ncbi:class I adenylate-forming enzyme family protein [Crossiella sp. NPDC003009]
MAEQPAGLPKLLLDIAAAFPDRTLLVQPGWPDVSARALLAAVQRAALRLREHGIGRDDRVTIETKELGWAEFLHAYLAVVWLGAVPVLAPEPEFAPAAELGARHVLAPQARAGVLGVAELLAGANGPAVDLAPVPAANGELDVVFTSGTTGAWKPVASTHQQWLETLPMSTSREVRQTKVVAHGGVPAAASAGVHGVALHHLARGVTSVWAASPPELIEACARTGAVELHMTPHSLRALLLHAELIGPEWAAQVRVIKTVGGVVPKQVGCLAMETFPKARVVCLYGLTEAGSALGLKVFDPERPDSIGRPLPGTEIRVVDNGKSLPAGEVGEIAVRRQGVPPLRYLREGEGLDDIHPDGWVFTGDLGYLAPDGEIHLVGRLKELLFLETGRTAPHVIEDELAPLLPRETDFAVVGVPSAGSWDEIVVFVAGTDDERTLSIVDKLRAVDGRFAPAHVEVLPEIPRTATGKAKRGKLTALFQQSRQAGQPV